MVTLAWNVGHLLVTLSSSAPQSDQQRWHADRSAPVVEGVPINNSNGRGGKPAAKAKPQRKTPALPHELVVDEAMRVAQDEKQNNTQCAPDTITPFCEKLQLRCLELTTGYAGWAA